MDGGSILLDGDTWIALDDCCDVQAPRPIATFSCVVRANRAIARWPWHRMHHVDPARSSRPMPYWID